jgi:glycosyltransferase involved in cell wall biosynthesis
VPLLRAAHQLGIPVRIAHSHAIRSAEGSLIKRAGFAVAQHLTKRYCTHGLAVSRPAAASLFGARWELDPRFEVVPLGVDFAPFQENAKRAELRKALGIGEHQIALAHVGRFAFVKNHEFIVAVAKAINRLSPDYRIVLVGDGPLLTRIQYLVHHEGLADRVIFLGSQPNVAEILLAMDAFIFPSTSEAFGIAAIEAQAAGLECFLSDRVVSTVDIVPELLHRLPLEAGPEAWAQEIISHTRPDISQAQALEKCLASDLNIDPYVEKHERIYSSVPA